MLPRVGFTGAFAVDFAGLSLLPNEDLMFILSSRYLLVAALSTAAAFYSSSTFADGDGCTTTVLDIMRCDAHSQRTREAVKAELHNAQARGEMKVVGELAGSLTSEPVPMQAPIVTRDEVKQEVARARGTHELHVGELY
jgi:hypothetical protein